MAHPKLWNAKIPKFRVSHVQDVTLYLFDSAILVCGRRDQATHYGQQRITRNSYVATLPLGELSLRVMDEIQSHNLIHLRCEEEDELFILEADGQEQIYELLEHVQATTARPVVALPQDLVRVIAPFQKSR